MGKWIVRFDVLDKGFVELIDLMPKENPDMAVVEAARVSYLGESKGIEKDTQLLHYLIDNEHWSPFEHVIFKFRVKAPVVVWWQWVRSRTQSYNFQSGRYSVYGENEFYVPEEWRLQSPSNKQASEGVAPKSLATEFHKKLLATYIEGYKQYKDALKYGIAKEQARLFLPAWGLYYTAYVTVNARNLIHFLKLRRAQEAQYEIRKYAEVLETIFSEQMPLTYHKVFGKVETV